MTQPSTSGQGARTCVTLKLVARTGSPNPLPASGALFAVRRPARRYSQVGAQGLDCGQQLDITLPAASTSVELTLIRFEEIQTVTVSAYRTRGPTARVTMHRPAGMPEQIQFQTPSPPGLEGPIERLDINAPSSEVQLIELCWMLAD